MTSILAINRALLLRCLARLLVALFGLAPLSLTTTAYGAPSCGAIRIASSSNEDLERNGAYVYMEVLITELRRAGCKVEFYPNSSLGNDEQRTELVELNLLHINLSSKQVIDNLSPLHSGLAMPFLFDGYDHFDRLLHETDFLNSVNTDLAAANLYIADVAFLGGMSGLFNTQRAIRAPSDLDGLRIRAMAAGDLAILKSWEVAATQVAWEEISQAMQTGIVDGYINPPLVPLMFGHTRQIKYFSELRLSPSGRQVVLSKTWFEALDDQNREILEQALHKARMKNRQWNDRITGLEVSELQQAGIEVARLTATERAIFVDMTRAHAAEIAPAASLGLIDPYVAQARSDQ